MLWFKKVSKPKQLLVTFTFIRVDKVGQLWRDWENELGAGKDAVWRISGFLKPTESLRLRLVGGTNQYQVFPIAVLELMDKPRVDNRNIPPPWPWNVLGVVDKTPYNGNNEELFPSFRESEKD